SVMALVPYTPCRWNDFRSAWMPAPPPESEPAMVRAIGGIGDVTESLQPRERGRPHGGSATGCPVPYRASPRLRRPQGGTRGDAEIPPIPGHRGLRAGDPSRSGGHMELRRIPCSDPHMPGEPVCRRALEAEGFEVVSWRDPADRIYEAHSHGE